MNDTANAAQSHNEFSKEEIAGFIAVGKRIAGKAVLSLVISMLEEIRTVDESLLVRVKAVAAKIREQMPEYAGYVQCSFKETPYLLNICLSLVDKTYRTAIDIPHESYANDVYNKYAFIKGIAVAYWRQFCEENDDIYIELSQLLSAKIPELVVDQANPTVLYLDENSLRRVGIFAYYVDQNGNPFYKK